MKAITIPVPGDADALVLDDVPVPEPGPTDVLVTVAAAGVNRADLMQRQGFYDPPPGASPYPGLEVSGTVAAVGEQVEGWSVGDEVCALLSGGGYAEQVAVPAGQLLPVPAGVSLRDAAALPEVVCTVWSNVFLTASLQPGQTLLVHGGSSGIGTMAIQLAREVGAHVAVTAGSAAKLEACRELGAEILVNYREQDFVEVLREHTGGAGADVILDNMGAKYLARNVDALADGRPARRHRPAGRDPGRGRPGRAPAQAGRRRSPPRCAPAPQPRRRPSWPPCASTSGRWSSPGGCARSSTAPTRWRQPPTPTASWRPARTSARCCSRREGRSPGRRAEGLVTRGCPHLPMFGLLADRRTRFPFLGLAPCRRSLMCATRQDGPAGRMRC